MLLNEVQAEMRLHVIVNSKQKFAYLNLDAKEELFVSDNRLDEYLDSTMLERGELAPLDNLITGHTRPERKGSRQTILSQ